MKKPIRCPTYRAEHPDEYEDIVKCPYCTRATNLAPDNLQKETREILYHCSNPECPYVYFTITTSYHIDEASYNQEHARRIA